MSFVKMRSAAASASGPEKSHLRSGDSSHTPTSWRTAWCSATASPNSVGQYQPSHSMNSASSAALDPVESRADGLGAHASSFAVGRQPNASETAVARASSGVDGDGHCLLVEAGSRALDADDRRELAAASTHRRGHGVEVVLALAPRAGPALPADAADLGCQRVPVDHRARREGVQRAVRQRDVAEGERHLPGGGGVGDAGPAEPRDALHGRRALDEVDGDRVGIARRRQRRRLAGLLGQEAEVRACYLAQVEAREHGVPQLEEPEAQAVTAGLGDVLDEPGVGQGGEQA